VFTAPETVEVREEAVPDPGPGEVLCRAEKSLISIGTETHCLRGIFDPGTNWSEWVQYPFRPGYSMVGRVVKVGPGVSGFAEGDRLATSATHQDYFTVTASGGASTGQPYGVVHLPAGLEEENVQAMGRQDVGGHAARGPRSPDHGVIGTPKVDLLRLRRRRMNEHGLGAGSLAPVHRALAMGTSSWAAARPSTATRRSCGRRLSAWSA